MKETITSTAIDFIGDVHGHAEELKELFEEKLGYKKTNGYYQNPTRKAFFVGDFIDRGPDIKGVLEIVKPMIENDAAYAVLGNHEYNAICYWTKDVKGNPLREHSIKNTDQHNGTIESVGKSVLLEYVEWFKTLPIYFEHDQFRVIHAQWKNEFIQRLKNWGVNNFKDVNFLLASSQKGSEEYTVIDSLLKGEEIHLPGIKFKDKGQTEREEYRIKWWNGGSNLTYRDTLFEFPPDAPDGILKEPLNGYYKDEVPVFFGHYWLKDRNPVIQQSNVCCLDYSVAKDGILVAYKWDGERELSEKNFEYV